MNWLYRIEFVVNWPNDTCCRPIYDPTMVHRPIRERVLTHLRETGISVAELARRTGVSYHVLNKFKHRVGGSTSAENGHLLSRYLDKFDGVTGDESDKRLLVSRLLADLPEEDLDEALSMLRYLHAKATGTGGAPATPRKPQSPEDQD